jgi:D-amino-acid dehydrogenase
VKIPVVAAKGYHLDLPCPDPAPRMASVAMETFVAITPLGDRLRLAGTLEFSGVNHRLVRRRLEMLVAGAAPYLRGPLREPLHEGWCGLRPCTPDGLPVIGWAPHVSGLFLATGHAKMGLTLGPGTGAAAAAMINGGEPPVDVSPLSPDRFV